MRKDNKPTEGIVEGIISESKQRLIDIAVLGPQENGFTRDQAVQNVINAYKDDPTFKSVFENPGNIDTLKTHAILVVNSINQNNFLQASSAIRTISNTNDPEQANTAVRVYLTNMSAERNAINKHIDANPSNINDKMLLLKAAVSSELYNANQVVVNQIAQDMTKTEDVKETADLLKKEAKIFRLADKEVKEVLNNGFLVALKAENPAEHFQNMAAAQKSVTRQNYRRRLENTTRKLEESLSENKDPLYAVLKSQATIAAFDKNEKIFDQTKGENLQSIQAQQKWQADMARQKDAGKKTRPSSRRESFSSTAKTDSPSLLRKVIDPSLKSGEQTPVSERRLSRDAKKRLSQVQEVAAKKAADRAGPFPLKTPMTPGEVVKRTLHNVPEGNEPRQRSASMERSAINSTAEQSNSSPPPATDVVENRKSAAEESKDEVILPERTNEAIRADARQYDEEDEGSSFDTETEDDEIADTIPTQDAAKESANEKKSGKFAHLPPPPQRPTQTANSSVKESSTNSAATLNDPGPAPPRPPRPEERQQSQSGDLNSANKAQTSARPGIPAHMRGFIQEGREGLSKAKVSELKQKFENAAAKTSTGPGNKK